MLSNLLSRFAAESEPAVHITPSDLFQINGVTITNSMLYGAICSVLILIVLITVGRRATVKPKRGLTQFVEVGTDFITNLLETTLGDREKALKYSPYFVSIFFFIMLSNWLGLLPVIGEAFTYNGHEPLFRPFTADLNGTLATATIAWVMVQFFAIRESGPINHLKHYFNGSFKNPITLLLGIFEMFSDLTRIASLALRLFLNVAIGEIIISVFAFLGKFAAPITALPFTMLELFVGALQAYIFVMLSIMYLAVAVKHGDHDEHGEEDHLTLEEVANLEVGKASN